MLKTYDVTYSGAFVGLDGEDMNPWAAVPTGLPKTIRADNRIDALEILAKELEYKWLPRSITLAARQNSAAPIDRPVVTEWY